MLRSSVLSAAVWVSLSIVSSSAWPAVARSVDAKNVAAKAYTPITGSCPDGFSLVRMTGSNQTLSTSETAYIKKRRDQVLPQAWKNYLASVQATGVALPSYASDILSGNSGEIPNLGIATSGGGYRAAIFGAGVLNALDGRNTSSTNAGLGGLLQAATYMSGLSGGSWFLTSLVQSNFPTMQNLIFGYSDPDVANGTWGGWNADYGIFQPSSNHVTDAAYLSDIVKELDGKRDAGFAVTIADIWGRALARHFTNGTFASNFYDKSYTHGAGILWSGATETQAFASHSIPFPIVVANVEVSSQNKSNDLPGDIIPISNPIFEFNVYEMGSFDPMLSAFAPTKYLGTTNTSVCVTNFDQTSLVAATSSELFNQLVAEKYSDDATKLVNKLGMDLDTRIPNPFHGVAPDTFIAHDQTDLELVDGGEDGEIIPLRPLLVQARGVDTIFAIDASSDIHSFANGTALIATQARAKLLASAYSFPPVPTTGEEFVSSGLTTRPTFFGCDLNGSTPLVIYLANGGPPADGAAPVTNTTTLRLSYKEPEIQAMLSQTFEIATQGYPKDKAAKDPDWPACLACAVVDRTRARTGQARSGVCQTCFERYCWSGSA